MKPRAIKGFLCGTTVADAAVTNTMQETRFSKRCGFILTLLLAGFTTLGCSQAVAPRHVRYSEINQGGLEGYTGKVPLIIEFQPGERVPMDFAVTSEDFELTPQHPALEIVAKHHCFVRIGEDGIRVSLDPEHFDEKPSQPGAFSVGVKALRGQPAKVEVAVIAPRR